MASQYIAKRKIKAIDIHSHFGTKRGYLWRTPEEILHAENTYNYKVKYHTEKEQAQYLRDAKVKVILDYSFTMVMSIEEVKEYHDYAWELMRNDPDVYLGIWVAINPNTGLAGIRELERCFKDLKVGVGFTSMSMAMHLPPSDKTFFPFYDLCAEANKPVHLMAGYTGWGAGFRGGLGCELEHCHPKYIDKVAAKFPNLNIIAARPAWPWQTEMIAILMHKANIIGYDLHGWSPKYFSQDLKWEISHRLQDRVMFGADYPLFSYDRLYCDWEAEGYSNDILDKVYFENSARILKNFGYNVE
ncbi:amidohydrolase family protein [Chloroflexota bacterium]